MPLAIAVVRVLKRDMREARRRKAEVWNVASGAGAEVLALERFDPEGLPDYLAHPRPSLRNLVDYRAHSTVFRSVGNFVWRLPAGGPEPIAAVSISS
jgi:hypothetical protein